VPLDGAFSPLHWVIVAVVALLVLGPDKLPDATRKAGHMWRDLRRIEQHLRGELRDAVASFDQPTGAGEQAPSSDPPDAPTSADLPPQKMGS
jgi:Sec-independent protein translocase protein TatA